MHACMLTYIDTHMHTHMHVCMLARSRCCDRFIVACILLNCVALAIERPERSALEETVTYTTHVVLTLIFWAEMLVKCVWYGPTMYARNAFNKVDTAVNLVSGADLPVYGHMYSM